MEAFCEFCLCSYEGQQCCHHLEDVLIMRVCMNNGFNRSFVRTGVGYGETSYR